MKYKMPSRLNKQTKSDPRLKSAQQRINELRVRQLQDQQISAEAQNLDIQFKTISGSVDEIKKAYEQIPKSVKNRMTFNPAQLDQRIQSTLGTIEHRITTNNRRIETSQNRQRNLSGNLLIQERAREDRFIEQNRAYNEAKAEIQKGILIPMNEIDTFANERGRQLQAISIEQSVKKAEQERIASQLQSGMGNITSINYETGRVVVDGQTLNLRPQDIQNLDLTSVQQARIEKELSNLIKKVETGKALTQADFNTARALGVKSSDLTKFASDVAKYQSQIKELERNAAEQRKKFEQSLGALKNIYTKQQLDRLWQSQLISPVLNVPKNKDVSNKLPYNINAYMSDSKIKKSQALRRLQLQAQRDDLNAQAALFGLVSTGFLVKEAATDLIVGIVKGAVSLVTSAKAKAIAAVNAVKNIDVKKLKDLPSGVKTFLQSGLDLEREIKSGNPEAIFTILLLAVPIPIGKAKSIKKGAKLSKTSASAKKIKDIDKQISDLEKAGVNVRQRTPAADNLRYLKDLKELDNKIKDLDRLIVGTTKTLKSNTRKINKGELPRAQKTKLTNNVNNIDKAVRTVEKARNTLATRAVKITKGDIKKAEALRDLFKVKLPKVKVKKALPTSQTALNKLLLEARAKGGNAFKKLKKRIKTEQGKNVVERKVKGGVAFKVLDPKKPKIKPAKPKGRKLVVEGKRIKKERKVKSKIEPKKLTKRELKQLEFERGQNLEKVANDIRKIAAKRESGMFKDKRASLTIQRSVNKFKKNVQRTSTKIKQDFQKYKNDYRKSVEINRQKNAQRIRQGKKAENLPKSTRQRLSKQRDSLKSAIRSNNKNLNALRKLTGTLIRLGLTSGLKTEVMSAQKVAQDIAQDLAPIMKELEKLDVPTRPVTPKAPSKPGKVGKPKAPSKPGKVGKPKAPKRPSMPKRPVVPKKITKVKKPRVILPKPKLTKSNRAISKQPLGEIGYVVTNPKTKKRTVIRVKTGLPLTEAKALGKQVVDNTLLASFEVKPYGKKEKRLALKSVDLSKFTQRKGKDKKVRTLVEKPKYRLDKPGEKKEISQARIRQLTVDRAKKIKAYLDKEQKKL